MDEISFFSEIICIACKRASRRVREKAAREGREMAKELAGRLLNNLVISGSASLKLGEERVARCSVRLCPRDGCTRLKGLDQKAYHLIEGARHVVSFHAWMNASCGSRKLKLLEASSLDGYGEAQVLKRSRGRSRKKN